MTDWSIVLWTDARQVAEQAGLQPARRWVDETDDFNGRAIYAPAEPADTQWPETLPGLAMFFSDGSISPEDLDPVTDDPLVSVHLAAAALQTEAIQRFPADEGVLARALDLGNQVAVGAREALTCS